MQNRIIVLKTEWSNHSLKKHNQVFFETIIFFWRGVIKEAEQKNWG